MFKQIVQCIQACQVTISTLYISVSYGHAYLSLCLYKSVFCYITLDELRTSSYGI